MEYRELGKTGIRVSRLCFGVLTVGPLQAGLPIDAGAKVIRYALENGVSFLDTAQYYKTYPYIKQALKRYSGEVVLASKSYAYTREMMQDAVEEARKETGRDMIDIFLLHEQESALTIKGHWEAYEYLLECKQKGIIRAAGISTHTVPAVLDACEIPEIDVIHPLYNYKGIGIINGDVNKMAQAIAAAAAAGKGIYSMKPLGGGNLLAESREAFDFVLKNSNLHSIAVGMKTLEEVNMNVLIFSGKDVPESISTKVKSIPRKVHFEPWCTGCGKCANMCTAGAIRIENGRAYADPAHCRVCGYCGPVCSEFCIKII
ncbi:aldo/keto reductase [Phosphitispora sp. TUW77]|uniref:aldo/keto reductase n=1 Tax=Phosphitispora sp. TUW77 TaxID=3152361 RepID=UPI003AB7DC6B